MNEPTSAQRLKERLDDHAIPAEHLYLVLLLQESSLPREMRLIDWPATELRRIELGGSNFWFGFIFKDKSILSHVDGYWIAASLN